MTYCGYVEFLMVIMFVMVIFLFFVLMILMLMFLLENGIFIMNFIFMSVENKYELEFLFSVWNLLFMFMVIMISMSVMVFSFSYMSGLKVANFVFLYSSFIISMLWLVLSNNFYWMMFGWDGLGVVSFLLIVFYMNIESINNGLFTMFQNRIGDLFFVIFILGCIELSMFGNLFLKWGLVFLIVGSCVKSAQFPFNAWLLSAMSAPTPISSLVHSSTLVVAGVVVLLQFSYCLMDCLFILKWISLLSLILSTFGLLNEFDMKKLIAYSTMNHVSLMMYLLSFGMFKVVYFHLNVHAMFKSLMFMCFGFLMLSSFHAQDKRLVSLSNLNPLIKIIYYFSCLCLAGLPFLSAFFSKDLIIEKFMEFSIEVSFIIFLLMFLGVSIYYSFKLVNLSNTMFSYSMVEVSILGMFSIFMMSLLMGLVINVYLSLVFSVSLEFVSFKMSVYFLVFVFLFLSILTNMNFKFFTYEKNKNFKEVWSINLYQLDTFMYWNFYLCLEYMNQLSNVKLILLMNWWVLIIFVYLF